MGIALSSGAHSRDPLAPPILRVQNYFRLPPIELPFQCESNSQRDLVMSDRPIFDMASRLHDFEPLHLANGLRCAGDGMLNGIFDIFFGRSYEFQDLINVILHFSCWHGEPPLVSQIYF